MRILFKNVLITILLLTILNCALIGKRKKDEHIDGGPTLTLKNETSFTLHFPFAFNPIYFVPYAESLWAQNIPDLQPNEVYTAVFEGLNYGQKDTTFEVQSTEWPSEQQLTVHIPKPDGPIFAPFWDDEHEEYGETIGIDYKIEWNDEEPNKGWVITFCEDEALTANPEKGPSPEVQELRKRNKLKEKQESQAQKLDL